MEYAKRTSPRIDSKEIMKEKFYITTTIPYANAPLHIGHALELVQADVIARHERQHVKKVFFLTGSDEYGSKNDRTAKEKGLTTKKFVDEMSGSAKKLKKTLDLSWDFFIRTTDKTKHHPGVKKMWLALEKSGDLYRKTYHGLYCSGCEAFLTEKDLVDGKCPEHNKEPELIEEENYFFRLSAYAKEIKKKIEEREMAIYPQWRANELLSLIDQGLEDVSFSRPKEKLSWGIEVPNDKDQVIYVWADALTNYISAIGYGRDEKEFASWWPADVHVLGKGVLRFHAAIWPAMLLSAGLELPKKFFVHGYITIDGKKISKSIGNVIDPEDVVKAYGTDAVRYYFLREVSPFEDGDFSHDRFKARYNADLANGLGNFFSRVTNVAQKFGPIKNDFAMMELSFEQKIKTVNEEVDLALQEFRFNDALAHIWGLLSLGDEYVNEKKPWESSNTSAQNEKTLFNLLVLLNAVALLLEPFLPQTSKTIQQHLSLKGKTIKAKKGTALFPRLE